MYDAAGLFRYRHVFLLLHLPVFTQKLETMDYRTAKNDRRRRRKAGFITALITATLLAAAAYTFGAFDAYFDAAPVEQATDQTVAEV